ncbi:hypothetical protein ACWC6I_41365, partial [Streptomyces sp. NPDC001414]
ADDARAYLADRVLDASRWQPLTDHLGAHPGGALATILSTPWRLCLTATVYQDDGNPAELLNLANADALDRHLLARYIPAAVSATANPCGYTPENVHRWLYHLTIHLDPAGILSAATPASAEATELVLHELWPLAGRTRVRTADAFLTALTTLTPLSLVRAVPEAVVSLLVLVIGIVTLAIVSGASAIATDRPNSLKNPLKTSDRKSLAFGLGSGILAGLTAGITVGLTVGVTTGITGGLTAGITVAITVGIMLGLGLGQAPDANLGARALIRSDALLGLTAGVVCWFAAGFAAGFAGGLATGLAIGLTFGLTFGLSAGLALTAQASRRYVVFLLCSRRRLPFRLGRFLDWAVTAGVMRYSGSAYQYRHRELQHWLRQHPAPPLTP